MTDKGELVQKTQTDLSPQSEEIDIETAREILGQVINHGAVDNTSSDMLAGFSREQIRTSLITVYRDIVARHPNQADIYHGMTNIWKLPDGTRDSKNVLRIELNEGAIREKYAVGPILRRHPVTMYLDLRTSAIEGNGISDSYESASFKYPLDDTDRVKGVEFSGWSIEESHYRESVGEFNPTPTNASDVVINKSEKYAQLKPIPDKDDKNRYFAGRDMYKGAEEDPIKKWALLTKGLRLLSSNLLHWDDTQIVAPSQLVQPTSLPNTENSTQQPNAIKSLPESNSA